MNPVLGIDHWKRAETVEEALAYQKQGYEFLAGGTQVNSTPYKRNSSRNRKVVDISPLKLQGITLEGDAAIIGAGVTLQELADSLLLPKALRKAASFIPTRNVRNIATIGGNIGANRADSYLIPILCALAASCLLVDGASVPVWDYCVENRNDLILNIVVPLSSGESLAIKESRSHLAVPVVSAGLWCSGERCSGDIKNGETSSGHNTALTGIRIFAGCVDQRVIRLKDVEKWVLDHWNNKSAENREILLEGLEEEIGKSLSPGDSILGSGEYRSYINRTLIADAVRLLVREVLG